MRRRRPRSIPSPSREVVATLAILSGLLLPTGSASGQAVCADPADATPISLAALWDASRGLEPGYRAAEARTAAADADRSALRRLWVPNLAVEGSADYGQRTSPGEERVLGVGPRSELRLLGHWTLIDGGRGSRSRAAEFRRTEAEAGLRAFDAGLRAELARRYVEATAAEARQAVREEQNEALEALAAPVRLRQEAGVDATWEAHRLEEALARSARLLDEATRNRDALRAELSARVGACVRPDAVDPTGPFEGFGPGAVFAEDGRRSPEIEQRLRAAEAEEALARGEAARDRWQLQLFGTVGPTRSRAFDPGPTEREELVGISARWSVDPGGVRSRNQAAGEARARALRADAESQREALDREVTRITMALDLADRRHLRLVEEVGEARHRRDATLLRWQEGMERWPEVLAAQERAGALAIEEIEWVREASLARIRLHEILGELERLPHALGQGAPRPDAPGASTTDGPSPDPHAADPEAPR